MADSLDVRGAWNEIVSLSEVQRATVKRALVADEATRGRIAKASNTHLRAQLVEAASGYQHRPAVGPLMAKRQERCS